MQNDTCHIKTSKAKREISHDAVCGVNGRHVLIFLLQVLALLLPFISICSATSVQDTLDQDLNTFVSLLKKETTPTLADYQNFYGYNDIGELQFQWQACEAKGWTPPLPNSDCYRETVKRWTKKKTSPSLYLAWLKKKLPSNPKLAIRSIEHVGGDGQIRGDRISVRLDKTDVIFWRPADKRHIAVYGRLTLTEIDGVPVAKLRQQATNNSVLIAHGLKSLIRPLTQEEIAERKKQSKTRCAADPECIKSMVKQERRLTADKKGQAVRQRIINNRQSWCKTNMNECAKMKAKRKALLGVRKQLQDQCKKDYPNCLKKVEDWLQVRRKERKPFCDKYPQDCKALDAIYNTRGAEQWKWCTEHPKDCTKSLTKFDQAVMEIRAALAAKQKQ